MTRLALRRILVASVALLLPGCTHTGVATTPATGLATRAEITVTDMRRRLEIIADDSMQGRESGRLGNVRATDYVARELTRLGLEPAGDVGGWFQSIPLVTRVADTVSVLVGSPENAASGTPPTVKLFYPNDLLPLRALGGGPFGAMFHGTGVAVVYGGRIGDSGLISPEQAKGKLVIFTPQLSGDGTITTSFLGTNGEFASYRDAWGVAIAGLERLPAPLVAFLRQPRDVLVDSSISAPKPIPGVVLTTSAAEQLLGAAIASLQGGAAGAVLVGGHVANVEYKTPYPARNVIGIVRGTDPALRNTFVAVGAHTDHVGMGVPVNHDSVRAFNEVVRPGGANQPNRAPTAAEATRIRSIRDSLARIRPSKVDSIFNGADDDGSGTVVALELAEWFATHRPRRSVLFVFHTAEEKGLFGAAYYTDHPTVARDSIVAQLNMDQVSRGGPSDVAGASPDVLYTLGLRRLSTELGDIVDATNARQSPPFAFDPVLDAPGNPTNAYCRSDHYMYARYGIPIAFFSRGWHRDYHMVSDEAQYSDAEVMRRVGTFMRDLTTRMANLDHRPLVDKPKPDPRGTCRQ
ncbi:MAG: M28 family peptidase [Gemmatimonadaceae bacterium]